jgi:hypothetical protein
MLTNVDEWRRETCAVLMGGHQTPSPTQGPTTLAEPLRATAKYCIDMSHEMETGANAPVR